MSKRCKFYLFTNFDCCDSNIVFIYCTCIKSGSQWREYQVNDHNVHVNTNTHTHTHTHDESNQHLLFLQRNCEHTLETLLSIVKHKHNLCIQTQTSFVNSSYTEHVCTSIQYITVWGTQGFTSLETFHYE